ncbi:GatB/YqeY domain-containing protein [Tepidiforma flava]|uniref:GatB/YqeY domain-containing protein n=1 Tax=Tepidiforma flava TaxID=3004094 RepID=A0ABY7M200_9CHLR|nr:GatB/YqeY domain-containing protein [Tepidiforma flava]WBL34739.1 GatB/YqeY domain-containing protein [Tepidiforma flava]
MSTLRDRIQADLADAMRSRDETRKSTLRMLLSAIKNAEIRTPPSGASDEELARMAELPPLVLDDAAVLALIQKQIKQRKESIEQFQKAGRQDLVDKESAEVAVLESYLPQQASREEIEAAARRVIAETGASSARDLGKVMPVLTKEFAGRADGRTINEIVRSLLGG